MVIQSYVLDDESILLITKRFQISCTFKYISFTSRYTHIKLWNFVSLLILLSYHFYLEKLGTDIWKGEKKEKLESEWMRDAN